MRVNWYLEFVVYLRHSSCSGTRVAVLGSAQILTTTDTPAFAIARVMGGESEEQSQRKPLSALNFFERLSEDWLITAYICRDLADHKTFGLLINARLHA